METQRAHAGGRRSLVRWLVPAGAVLAAALLAAYAYHRGQVAAGLDAAQVLTRTPRPVAKASRLEKENARLNAQVAELEMSRQARSRGLRPGREHAGRAAVAAVATERRPCVLQSIVSPADGIQGLRIQRFEVQPGGAPREFLLKLTLIQAMRHESTASGLAQVVVHGMQGDQPARYSVGELLGRPKAQLPFSFRYFQTLEQSVTLPEGFEAFEAEVQVRSSKLRSPMQQSFPWKVAGQPTA